MPRGEVKAFTRDVASANAENCKIIRTRGVNHKHKNADDGKRRTPNATCETLMNDWIKTMTTSHIATCYMRAMAKNEL